MLTSGLKRIKACRKYDIMSEDSLSYKKLGNVLKEINDLMKNCGDGKGAKYRGVEKKFKVRKHITGSLGELQALCTLYKKKGIESKLAGGHTAGYDIITKDDKLVQVKSSFDGNNFAIMNVKFKPKEIKLVKRAYERARKKKGKKITTKGFKLPSEIKKLFEKEFDDKYNNPKKKVVDYWILFWVKERRYFIIPNRKMRQIAYQSYEIYTKKTEHRKDYNYGIGDKTNLNKAILLIRTKPRPGYESWITKQLLKYEDKWW